MFDLFGNIQEQQEQIARKLREVEITHQSSDHLVSLKINANKEVLDISINAESAGNLDIAQLEDQLVITLNEAFEQAAAEADRVSQEAIRDILPGGMEGLGGLFGNT